VRRCSRALIAADLAWAWGRSDPPPHSCLVKYIWNAITFLCSLPIVAQGRPGGTSEISLLGSASPSKTKSELVPAQRLSGGRFSHAPSHLGSVERFLLHTFIFQTSFHERSKKTEAIDFCCAVRGCDALSRAMFYSNGKQE
jgi:hypothetical protein